MVKILKHAGINAGNQAPDCECYHYRDDMAKIEVGSNPDCPVHFPRFYDRDGVELGRNCVTLDYCTKQNLCYGHCKLY